MKLTIFKEAKALNESKMLTESIQLNIGSGHGLTAETLHNKKIIDQIADEIHDEGFPASFTINVKISTGDTIPYVFELDDKYINDSKHYHQLAFCYAIDMTTNKKIRALIKKAQEDETDVDGEKADELYDELKVDTIVVWAEFAKSFSKIFGSTEPYNGPDR